MESGAWYILKQRLAWSKMHPAFTHLARLGKQQSSSNGWPGARCTSAFVKMPAWSPQTFRRTPHIGEHNDEVYSGEIGVSWEGLVALKQAG